MSKWVDRIANHPVHEEIKKFYQTLREASSITGINVSASEAIARLDHINNTVKRSIDQADPIILAPSTLNTINKNLQQCATAVSSFISDQNEQNLDTANDTIDNIMPSINRILIKPHREDLANLSKAVKSLLDITDEQVQSIGSKTENGLSELHNLKNKVGDLATTISNEKTRIDQAITQHQQQFSDAQDSRQRQFDESTQGRLKKFDVAQSTWETKFSSLESDQQQKFNELLSSFEKSDQDFRQSTSEEAKTLTDKLKSQCGEAKKIVGIISGTGMAGGYQKDANAEQRASIIWNILAVCSFGGLIVFSLILFLGSGSDNFSWQAFVSKLLAIGAFGGFATYAGHMASRHRESERQHRHKQLALELIHAFIEDLEPQTQKELKQQIAGAFFVRSSHVERREEEFSPTVIDGVIKLLNTTKSLVKSK